MIRFSRNDSLVKRDVLSPVGDLISHLKSIFIYLFLVTFSNQLYSSAPQTCPGAQYNIYYKNNVSLRFKAKDDHINQAKCDK